MSEDAKRRGARARAASALARGDATGWFEELYATAAGAEEVPWADLVPNPMLVSWLSEHGVDGAGRRALKVGALRPVAAQAIGGLLAPGGTLLVIARGRDSGEDEGAMPWPLTPGAEQDDRGADLHAARKGGDEPVSSMVTSPQIL